MNRENIKINLAKEQTAESLRALWKDYFVKNGHVFLSSSSLIPEKDPSLLFTTAGMVPLKDFFAGKSKAPHEKLVTIQKCLRTTDLDSVGKTDRHCTFFEMLGNFSFGAYFKKEAIKLAWDFSLQVLQFDPRKIYVTVFQEDQETEEIWTKSIGVEPSRIKRLGKEENWWGPAGDSGPCGPCSELYLDRGSSICETCNCQAKELCSPGGEGERFLEYWNLVFNEYYCEPDGTLSPLPQKGIDTGAGLERILMLLEGKDSVYDTQEFQNIFHAIENMSHDIESKKKGKILSSTEAPISYRVLADHIRSVSFAMSDGMIPSNTGRGYVVRRMIRRAVLYARELGIYEPFFYRLSTKIVDLYGNTYPELIQRKNEIQANILSEEKRFLETLEIGLKKWELVLQGYELNKKDTKDHLFSGEDAFLLYDTYGFPLELTVEMAERKGLRVDHKEFELCMEKQRIRARKSFSGKDISLPSIQLPETVFQGYHNYETSSSIQAIIQDGKRKDSCEAGDHSILILDQTPCYPEGGGQLGDTGQIVFSKNSLFFIQDTQKSGELILHIGYVKTGKLSDGMKGRVQIDQERRRSLTRHHSATHLLNQALRQTLGDHVCQTGSLVAHDRLRFDFSHPSRLSGSELEKISSLVHSAILKKTPVVESIMPIEQAQEHGALSTFGEKYGKEVRVISMGENGALSKELCGGCHVKETTQVGFFHIVRQSSPGAGMRRIEAIAGDEVRKYFAKLLKKLNEEISLHNDTVKEFLSDTNHVFPNHQIKSLSLQHCHSRTEESSASFFYN